MLLHVRQVLDADELARRADACRRALGRRPRHRRRAVGAGQEQPAAAAGRRGARAAADRARGAGPPRRCSSRRRCRKRVFPPLFNRYGGAANAFGNHVDNAIRFVPGSQGERVRTDICCTLFLTEPDDYDGGELVVEDTFGAQRVKLPAGDMVLYPGTSVHRVEPVTRGERAGQLLLDREHGAQRRAAPPAVRHGHAPDAPARDRSAKPTRRCRPDRHVPQPAAHVGRRLSPAPRLTQSDVAMNRSLTRAPWPSVLARRLGRRRRPARREVRADPEGRVEAAGRARAQAHRPGLEDPPRQDHQRLLRGLRPRREEPQGRGLLPSEDLRGRHRAQVSGSHAPGLGSAGARPALDARRASCSAGRRPDGSSAGTSRSAMPRSRSSPPRSSGASTGPRYARFAQFVRGPRATLALRAAGAARPRAALRRPQPARRVHGDRAARLHHRPGADRLALHDRPILRRRDRRDHPRRAGLDPRRARRSCTSAASSSRAFVNARTSSRRCSMVESARRAATTSRDHAHD